MSELQVRPFYGYGYRRVYVYTGDGRHVGWFDPNSASAVLELEEYRTDFDATVAAWPPPAHS